MCANYIKENPEVGELKIDQCVIVNQEGLKSLVGAADGAQSKKKLPTRSLTAYNACNSYYLFLEDMDAHERATNLFPPLTYSFDSLTLDAEVYPFSERGTQLAYLNQTPVNFLILGKPGIGEKELGKMLSDYWKCVYIHPETLIEEEISSGSRTGQCIEFNLRCGRAIGIDIILRLVEKRIRSKSAQHRGYVLCGFPLVANDLYEEDPVSSESAVFNVQEIFEDIFTATIDIGVPPEVKVQVSKTSNFVEGDDEAVAGEENPEEAAPDLENVVEVEKPDIPKEPVDVGSTTGKICGGPDISLNYDDQINFLFSLVDLPFVTIYVSCNNADVISKRDKYRFNVATKETVNMEKNLSENMVYTVFSKESSFSNEIPEDFADIAPLREEIDFRHLEHLVKLPRDFTACVVGQLEHYRYGALQTMEKYVLMNEPGYFIKLDGRIPPAHMFNSIKVKLQTLPLQKVVIPQRFSLREETLGGEGAQVAEDIDIEGFTPEEFFKNFHGKDIANKMFKYTWSDWGSKCPVSMKEGIYLDGDPKYAVHFMNKMFFLSSEEAYNKFIRNPRPYLVLPYPKPSSRIAVMGPDYAGKTSVSKCISYLLDAQLLSPFVLKEKYIFEKRNKYIEKCRSDAITEVMARMEADYKVAEVEKEEGQKQQIVPWVNAVRNLIEEYMQTVAELDKSTKEVMSSFPLSLASTSPELLAVKGHLERIEQEFTDYGLNFFGKFELCREILSSPQKLHEYLPPEMRYYGREFIPPSVFDPVIEEYAEAAVRNLNLDEIELTLEDQFDVFKEAIRKAEENNEARGCSRGGWVIDGLTPNLEIITELGPKFVDDVIVLKDSSENNNFLFQRFLSKENYEFQKFRDLFLELENVNAAFRVPTRSTDSVKKRFCSSVVRDLIATLPLDETDSIPGEVDEEFLENVAEEEYFIKHPRASVVNAFASTMQKFNDDLEEVLPFFEENNVNVTILDVSNCTMKDLLLKVIRNFEGRYSQKAVAVTPEDRVQELEDFGEPVNEEPFGEEGGEGEEKGIQEDTFFERRRFGDTFNYCPVTFHKNFVLWRGKEEYAAKFENKLYLFCSEDALNEFLERPKDFLLKTKPPDLMPPPRMCVVGVSGSGKTLLSKALARNMGLYYINFERLIVQRVLTDLQYRQTVRKSTARIDELNIDYVSNYISNGDALPDELLDALLPLWLEEPKRSTGFVLDGFPRRPSDVEYMVKRSIIPDVIIELDAAQEIVHERIVVSRLEEWRRRIEKERNERIRNHKNAMERWQLERAYLFTEMMETKRQERYAARLESEEAEKLAVVEEGKENEDNEELQVKTAISLKSIEEDADAQEVNRRLDELLPEPELLDTFETEENAAERIVNTIQESFMKDATFLNLVREYADGEQMTWLPINGNMPVDAVFSQTMRYADKIKFRPNSLFERCYDVPLDTAEQLLALGYYFFSPFGRMCPVQYTEEQNPVQLYLPLSEQSKLFPLIYRYHIYFLAGKNNRDKFKKDPLIYIRHDAPIRPNLIPFRMSVIGPPVTGKSTLSMRLAKELGLKYITIGRSVRYVLQYLPHSTLAKQVEGVLQQGWELTPEMAAKCVEAMTMDGRANSQGCIYDGFPNIRHGVYYLAAYGILPHVVIDVQASHDDILALLKDLKGKKNMPPLSLPLVEQRYKEWSRTSLEFRSFLSSEYQNVVNVSIFPSKWGVWTEGYKIATDVFQEIKKYFDWVNYDTVLRLEHMLVSPLEFIERRGIFKHFCPVCMYHDSSMISGGEPPDRRGLVQYKKWYYWVCDNHMDNFNEDPELYLPPNNNHLLPADLPTNISAEDLEKLLNGNFEDLYEEGLCVVCAKDNKPKRVLNEGRFEFALKFEGNIYLFDTQECYRKFKTQPQKYSNFVITFKDKNAFPSCSAKELPVLGFLEQYEADILVKAVSSCSILRPLLPGLTPAISAAICIGLYLKCNNPKTSELQLDFYKEAQDKMHNRHLKLIDHLTEFKETINPYIYYEEPIPEFDETDWNLPTTILPAIEMPREAEKHTSVDLIIEDILSKISY